MGLEFNSSKSLNTSFSWQWDWPQQWTFIQRWGWFNFQTSTPFKTFSGISQTTLRYLEFFFFFFRCYIIFCLNMSYSKEIVHELYYSRHFRSTRYIWFKLNIIDSVIDDGIQGWEHKVRPPSKRRCPTLYYSFLFYILIFSFFPFFMCAAVREGAKRERSTWY